MLDDPVLTTAGPIGRMFEKIEAILSMIVVVAMSLFVSVEAIFGFIFPWMDQSVRHSPGAIALSMCVGVLGLVLLRVNWSIMRWTYHFTNTPRACVALSVVKMMRRQPTWVRRAVPLAAVCNLVAVWWIVLGFQLAIAHDLRDHSRVAGAVEITSQIGLAYGSNLLLMLILSAFAVRSETITRFYHARYALDLAILIVLWLAGNLGATA
jgi:hypothetical protein